VAKKEKKQKDVCKNLILKKNKRDK